MATFNPKSLRELAGELVLIHYPHTRYTGWSSNFIENANLLNATEMTKISTDTELSYENWNTYHMKYLILDEPMRGMYYAAKHGIPALYRTCRNSLKKKIFNECRQRSTDMKYYEMDEYFRLYLKPCLHYLRLTALKRTNNSTDNTDEVMTYIRRDLSYTVFTHCLLDKSSHAFMTTYMNDFKSYKYNKRRGH